MKPGKLTGLFARIFGLGGTITACATQVAAFTHAAGGVANTAWLTLAASKVASTGFMLLGPVATGVHSLFGAAFGAHAAGALTASLSTMFGAGVLAAFTVPIIVGLTAIAAYKFFAALARTGGEKLDQVLDAATERKQKKAEEEAKTMQQEAEPEVAQEKTQPLQVGESVSSEVAPPETAHPPAPASAPIEETWHPANDAEKRGVSYRHNVLSKAYAQQGLHYAPG